MVAVLFEVLVQGLKLWNQKESTKYLDEVLDLQRRWLEEYNKPRSKRSNADLDHYEQQLCLISKQFTSSFGKPNS
jgi:hypothetical protein